VVARTLFEAMRRDLRVFRERLRPSPLPARGLHTYRFSPPEGKRRVHLRIDADGGGVLFIDVTDVIRLNPTAARIAHWALEGVLSDLARASLLGRFGRSSRDLVERDVASFYSLVERLREPWLGCPTCTLTDVQRTDPFSGEANAPFKADLALTYECNNDCPHCYNEPEGLARDGLLPARDWRRIIDVLCKKGVPHLIFTGGEATLHPHFLEILQYADTMGPVCGLNTNGRRLAHRGYVDELQDAGLEHVQITLGSHEAAVHDRMMNARSFHQTVKGIQNAVASGIHTITNTTLMQMNAPDIEETISFLHGLGIRTFAVNGMIYSGGGFDTGQAILESEMAAHLVRIRDRARELDMKFLWYTPTEYCRLSPVELDIGAKRCNAGEYSLCVEPDGSVLPCQSFYVAAGNLLRDPWEKIWNGSLFRSFRLRELDPVAAGLPDKCHECPDLPLCGGGCRIARDARDGVRTSEGSGCGSACGGCGSAATSCAPRPEDGKRRRSSGQFSPG